MSRSLYIRMLLLALLVGVGLSWVVLRKEPHKLQNKQLRSTEHAQLSDVPFDMAEGWNPRFVLLSPYERAEVPVIDGFSAPMGNRDGALTYVAQGFLENNPRRGGKHLGDDWNGIGGMNTDLGDPVYAAARGLVVYSGRPGPGWGRVVILAHRLPEGGIVQSMYAHLAAPEVMVGRTVGRGQKLGEIGTAAGSSAAHLHFEILEGATVDAAQPGYASGPRNRLEPGELFRKYPPRDLAAVDLYEYRLTNPPEMIFSQGNETGSTE